MVCGQPCDNPGPNRSLINATGLGPPHLIHRLTPDFRDSKNGVVSGESFYRLGEALTQEII
jgi:hypothetical protein